MSCTRFTAQTAVKDAQENTQTQRGSGLTAWRSLHSASVYRLGAHSGKNVRACADAWSLHYLMNVSHARAAASQSGRQLLLGPPPVFLDCSSRLVLTSVGSLCGKYNDFQRREQSARPGLEMIKWYSKFTLMMTYKFNICQVCQVCLFIFSWIYNALSGRTLLHTFVFWAFFCLPLHLSQGEKPFSYNMLTTNIVFSDHCYCTKLLCKTLRWDNSLLHLRFDQVTLS